MTEVSAEQVESTRKVGNRLRKEVGDAIATFTQVRAAEFMETSPSTVNRIVVNDLDGVCHMLAVLGYQLAPLNAVVIDREDLQAFKRMAFKYLQSDLEGEGRA